MKTIIAGSRRLARFTDHEPVWLVADAVMKSGWRNAISLVLCGEALGIDLAGSLWADSVRIPVESFPAEWDKHGRAAGILRNSEMVDKADALIAIWDGRSRGTADTIRKAMTKPIKVFVYRVDDLSHS